MYSHIIYMLIAREALMGSLCFRHTDVFIDLLLSSSLHGYMYMYMLLLCTVFRVSFRGAKWGIHSSLVKSCPPLDLASFSQCNLVYRRYLISITKIIISVMPLANQGWPENALSECLKLKI